MSDCTYTYAYPAVRETFCRVLGRDSVETVPLQRDERCDNAISSYLRKTHAARRAFAASTISFR